MRLRQHAMLPMPGSLTTATLLSSAAHGESPCGRGRLSPATTVFARRRRRAPLHDRRARGRLDCHPSVADGCSYGESSKEVDRGVSVAIKPGLSSMPPVLRRQQPLRHSRASANSHDEARHPLGPVAVCGRRLGTAPGGGGAERVQDGRPHGSQVDQLCRQAGGRSVCRGQVQVHGRHGMQERQGGRVQLRQGACPGLAHPRRHGQPVPSRQRHLG